MSARQTRRRGSENDGPMCVSSRWGLDNFIIRCCIMYMGNKSMCLPGGGKGNHWLCTLVRILGTCLAQPPSAPSVSVCAVFAVDSLYLSLSLSLTHTNPNIHIWFSAAPNANYKLNVFKGRMLSVLQSNMLITKTQQGANWGLVLCLTERTYGSTYNKWVLNLQPFKDQGRALTKGDTTLHLFFTVILVNSVCWQARTKTY